MDMLLMDMLLLICLLIPYGDIYNNETVINIRHQHISTHHRHHPDSSSRESLWRFTEVPLRNSQRLLKGQTCCLHHGHPVHTSLRL